MKKFLAIVVPCLLWRNAYDQGNCRIFYSEKFNRKTEKKYVYY